MEPIIVSKNLRLIYEKGTTAETIALRDVNFTINREEFVIIFGPSGCGKSTLLYAMAGIERNIDAGEVWIKGKDIIQMTTEEMMMVHRKEIGMVFQAYNLITTLNVLDNVALPLTASGVNKKIRERKAKFLLSRFEVGNYLTRFPQNLSGGQQQRVGIARSLVTDPEIVFADEPTGNLDSRSAENVMKALVSLSREDKKTVILVTHDPSHLLFADRIIHMKDGRVVREEIRKREDIVEKVEPRPKFALPIDLTDSKTPSAQTTPTLLLTEGCEAGGSPPLFNIKTLSYYFDWNFTEEEEIRLRQTLEKFVEGKISKHDLFKILDKSYKKGGLGFYWQKARRLTDEIEKMVNLSKALKDCVDSKKNVKTQAGGIAEWLLSDYHRDIDPAQFIRAEEAITKRLKGHYIRQQFQNHLDAPLDEGGAGFTWKTSRNLSRKLEMILA